MGFKITLSELPQLVMNQVKAELPSRAERAVNVLINAKNEVLEGQRSGKWYGSHQASAAGEAPANWHGDLRKSFHRIEDDAYIVGIYNPYPYANYLEEGTKKMAPRPFRQPIIDKAKQEIEDIYKEPWHIKV